MTCPDDRKGCYLKMMEKKEENLEGQKLRKARRTRRIILLSITAAAIVSLAVVAELWPRPAMPPVTAPASFIGIQHALTSQNDTKVGTPPPGYVYADFSLQIMNCGYQGFPVGPSLFDLVVGGVTYKVSNATANLPAPLNSTTVANEQTLSGQLTFLIPVGSTIPNTPLVYTGSSFNIKWTSAW